MLDVWQSLISGALAATVAVTVCCLIEKLGGALGGVVGTVPGTITPAALGLWNTRDSLSDFRVALCAAPVGLAVNAVFLLSWRVIPPRLPAHQPLARRLALLVGASLLVWATLATPSVLLLRKLPPRAVYAVCAACALLVLSAGVVGTWRMPPAPSGAKSVGFATQAARGALAFVAVALAVLLSHLSPAMAGISAVFPAVFLTAMTSLWLAQGEACQTGAVSPMMVGLTAPMLFCAMSCATFPMLGAALGCATAWIGAVALGTFPIGAYIKWRERVMRDERSLDAHTRELHDVLTSSLLNARGASGRRGDGENDGDCDDCDDYDNSDDGDSDNLVNNANGARSGARCGRGRARVAFTLDGNSDSDSDGGDKRHDGAADADAGVARIGAKPVRIVKV